MAITARFIDIDYNFVNKLTNSPWLRKIAKEEREMRRKAPKLKAIEDRQIVKLEDADGGKKKRKMVESKE